MVEKKAKSAPPAKPTKEVVAVESNGKPKRGRGRPPKNGVAKATPKPTSGRGRGRPPSKKVESAESEDEEENDDAEDDDNASD